MQSAFAAIPPAEDLVRLPAPRFPSPIEMLVAVNDGHRFLEWYIVECLMRGMETAFAHMEAAKTLRQWAKELAPGLRLREPSPEHGLSLITRAVRIEHSELPPDRFYFLTARDPDRPITFLDPGATEQDGAYTFRRFHIATLNIGWLFPPAIVRLAYETLSYTALTGPVETLREVELALVNFKRELRQLFAARGMKW